jgi:ribonuclease HII
MIGDLLPEVDLPIEEQLIRAGYVHVYGVDEAGRGPLAGPVVAAAVLYRPCEALKMACDSKLIPAKVREVRCAQIMSELIYGVGIGSVEEIDSVNILQASMLAWRRAVEQILQRTHSIVLVDGNYPLPGDMPSRAIVDGDARVAVIGAASIVAKVTRDRMMAEYHELYPQYGFAHHMGYPTTEHRRILKVTGPCPIHRKTFHGVREFYSSSD